MKWCLDGMENLGFYSHCAGNLSRFNFRGEPLGMSIDPITYGQRDRETGKTRVDWVRVVPIEILSYRRCCISKTQSYLVANFSTLQYLEALFCLVATLLTCELAMSSTEYMYKYYCTISSISSHQENSSLLNLTWFDLFCLNDWIRLISTEKYCTISNNKCTKLL